MTFLSGPIAPGTESSVYSATPSVAGIFDHLLALALGPGAAHGADEAMRHVKNTLVDKDVRKAGDVGAIGAGTAAIVTPDATGAGASAPTVPVRVRHSSTDVVAGSAMRDAATQPASVFVRTTQGMATPASTTPGTSVPNTMAPETTVAGTIIPTVHAMVTDTDAGATDGAIRAEQLRGRLMSMGATVSGHSRSSQMAGERKPSGIRSLHVEASADLPFRSSHSPVVGARTRRLMAIPRSTGSARATVTGTSGVESHASAPAPAGSANTAVHDDGHGAPVPPNTALARALRGEVQENIPVRARTVQGSGTTRTRAAGAIVESAGERSQNGREAAAPAPLSRAFGSGHDMGVSTGAGRVHAHPLHGGDVGKTTTTPNRSGVAEHHAPARAHTGQSKISGPIVQSRRFRAVEMENRIGRATAQQAGVLDGDLRVVRGTRAVGNDRSRSRLRAGQKPHALLRSSSRRITRGRNMAENTAGPTHKMFPSESQEPVDLSVLGQTSSAPAGTTSTHPIMTGAQNVAAAIATPPNSPHVAHGLSAVAPAVGREVMDFVKLRGGGNGLHRARIRIHPPELGSVSIHMDIHNRRVSMELVVDSRDVKAILDAHHAGIRAALGEHGLSLDSFQVGMSYQSHANPGGAQGHGTDSPTNWSTARVADDGPGPVRSGAALGVSDTRVNVLA